MTPNRAPRIGQLALFADLPALDPTTDPVLVMPDVLPYTPDPRARVLALLYNGWESVGPADAWVRRLAGRPGVPGDAKVLGPCEAQSALVIHRSIERITPGDYLVYTGDRVKVIAAREFLFVRTTSPCGQVSA